MLEIGISKRGKSLCLSTSTRSAGACAMTDDELLVFGEADARAGLPAEV